MKAIISHHSSTILIALSLVIAIGGYWAITVFQQNVRQGQLQDYISRGNLAANEKNYPQAFTLFGQALNLEPRNANIVLKQADVAFLNGDYSLANTLYDTAEQTNTAETIYYRALTSLAKFDYPESINLLNQTHEQLTTTTNRGDRPLTLTMVTQLYQNIQDIEKITNTPLQQATTGKLLIENKAYLLAKESLTETTTQQPNYRDAHYLLAVAYLHLGEKEPAQTQAEISLTLDPNYAPAQTLISSIKGSL